MRTWVFLFLATSFLATPGIAQTPAPRGTPSLLKSFPKLNIKGVAIDSSGAIVVAGTTTQSGYPTTPNAIQSDYRSTSCTLVRFPEPCTDGYIARISRGGAILYGSY